MSTLEDDRSLPLFASLNPAPSPFFYFHHIVNGEDTTLTIQVIGPNLEFKFAHSRAKAYLTPTQIAHRLANKTVGFLALVTPTGERTVLAAAESGHGGGKLGDMLDAAPGVLANMLWTKRVVAVGRLLGLSMESPFDSGGGPRVRGRQGLFRGSHAEVKLAVHGIAVLLDVFGITKDFDAVTARHLRGLRDKRWEDGTRPRFEVFFSRKHCGSCGKLVRALEEATGVSIQLLWKPRLELKQYAKANPTAASRRRQRVPRLVDEQDRDLGDQLSKEESDDETVGGEESGDEREEEGDVQVIDMVDLISHPSFTISPTPHPADDVQVIDTIDLVSRPSFSVELTPHPADDYINGLAYRVGQIQSSPDGAAEAIVQFAQQMTGNRVRWITSAPPAPPAGISKPLPATPATEPPAWMTPRNTSTASKGCRLPVRSRSPPSLCERAALRCRSPRRYSTGILERTVLGERRARSYISVEIPARRRSA